MLIRKEQSDYLLALTKHAFYAELLPFLRTHYPDKTAFASDEEVMRWLAPLMEESLHFGLATWAQAARYIVYRLDFVGFPVTPQWEWALRMLRCHDMSPEEKLVGLDDRLYGGSI